MRHPDDINLAWRRLASLHGYDPLLDDRQVDNILSPSPDDAGIGSAIERIRMLKELRPAFFQEFHYDWALNRQVYGSDMEAHCQLRLLFGVSEAHALAESRGVKLPSTLSDIVVRRTWTMDALAARPLTPAKGAHSGFRFVVIPLGFIENAVLLSRALTSPDQEPTLLTILTILLSSVLSQTEDPLDLRNVQRELLSHAPLFRNALNHVDGIEATPREGALAYAITDFVMYHEAAHILYDDAPDAAQDEAAEERANQFATEIYGLTWGWRNAELKTRGMTDTFMQTGGPISFIAMATLQFSLQAHIALRLAELDPIFEKKARQLKTRVDVMARRCESLDRYVSQLESALIAHGAATPEQCQEVRSIFAGILPVVERSLPLINQISSETLDVARAIKMPVHRSP